MLPTDPAATGHRPESRDRMVSMAVIRAWLDALQPSGSGRARLLERLGLTEAALQHWDTFVDLQVELEIVRWAVRRRGGAAGLHAAAALPRGGFAVLEYLARTAKDLRGATDYLVRFGRLLGSAPLFLKRSNRLTHIRYTPAYDVESVVECALAEFAIAAVAKVAADALRPEWAPTGARFIHAPLATQAEYSSVLLCPVEFRCAFTELLFPTRMLRAPMREADRRLHALLHDCARSALGTLEDDGLVAHSVRRLIADDLRTGKLSLERVAKQLGFTARTLQNRLRSEGTSLTKITDSVRRELAERYLTRPQTTVPEVALLLGYSEPSAFHRAFKRWTGTTPRQFRVARLGLTG